MPVVARQVATILLAAFITSGPVFQTTKSAGAFWWAFGMAAATGAFHLLQPTPKQEKGKPDGSIPPIAS